LFGLAEGKEEGNGFNGILKNYREKINQRLQGTSFILVS